MKKFKFIWLLLTDKVFFNGIKTTLLYAFRVNKVVGGKDSTDINHINYNYSYKILKNRTHYEFNKEKKFKIPPSSLINILEKYTDEELDELKKEY